jgi:hypothetical protein
MNTFTNIPFVLAPGAGPVPGDKTDDCFDKATFVPWTDGAGNDVSTFVGIIGNHVRPDRVVLHCFGIGQYCHQETAFAIAKDMSLLLDSPVVVFDYPGYGVYRHQQHVQKPSGILERLCRSFHSVPDHDPFTTQDSVYRCADRVMQQVRIWYPDVPIVLWGHSIGTAVACHLVREDIDHLVLQSPLCSVITVGTGSLSWTIRALDFFSTLDSVEKGDPIKWPKTLIVHGAKDKMIGVKHAYALRDAINNRYGPCASLYVLKLRTHVDIEVADFAEQVVTLFQ